MRTYIALLVALVLLPFAYVLHLTFRAWNWWHFGPSQSILRGLRWMNYKAAKPVAHWLEVNLRDLPWRKQ